MKAFRGACVIALVLFLVPFAASAQLVSFSASNQNLATVGFETNAYDWMLNPLFYGQIDASTLFVSLDAYGSQLGSGIVGSGFRGGYAWIMPGFSPLLMLDYRTTASSSSADEAGNTQLSYTGYDAASGRYGTITQTVNITPSSVSPAQKLIAQFGGKMDGPINFDAQFEWLLDNTIATGLSYQNTYTNTTAPTDSTLSSMGARTDTTIALRNNAVNVLALEGEVGLAFGSLTSRISLGTGLMNWDYTAPSYDQTATSYSAGSDPTKKDTEVHTIYAGAYYYSSGSATASYAMDTNTPNYLPYVPLSLDSSTLLTLEPSFTVEIPFSFTANFVPATATTNTSRTMSFDDVSSQETSRLDVSTVNAIAYGRNLSTSLEGVVRKSFSSGDAILYLGSGLKLAYNGWQATRTSTNVTHTQTDGNANGNYTDAGVDTDTTYTKSGYGIVNSNDQIATTLRVPVAVTWTPLPNLSFHAGTETSMTATCTLLSSTTTGTSSYIYETFTDNLVSANSYAQRQISGSSNASVPASSSTWGFAFNTTGRFGVTLAIADNFTIDALAQTSYVGFGSFSLTGVYRF
jgi:hypothetical protein